MHPIKRMLVVAAASAAGLLALANPAAAGDGNVDGRDFVVWSAPATPTAAAGDGNVDGRDLVVRP